MKFNRVLLEHLNEAFQRDEVLSGEVLGQSLGISRAAVWKQIHNLKSYGIAVGAEEGVGYRLKKSYQLIDEKKLDDSLNWHYSIITDSTNSDLHSVVNLPAAATTEQQNQGRGRRGKSWQSQFASSILLSVKHEINLPMNQLGGLSLACGVVVFDVLKRYQLKTIDQVNDQVIDQTGDQASNQLSGQGLSLKWPNDIYYSGKKMAGLLVELEGEVEGPCNVIVGLGLNIDLDNQENIDQPFESLSNIINDENNNLNISIDRTALSSELALALVDCINTYQAKGFSYYHEQWHNYHCWQNKQVQTQGGKNVQGVCIGVDETGALLIKNNEGIIPIVNGEISLREWS